LKQVKRRQVRFCQYVDSCLERNSNRVWRLQTVPLSLVTITGALAVLLKGAKSLQI